MKADFPVILDACVLANARVCDLFLRLAETPRLYLPFWSETLLNETQRTHVDKLKWPAELSESWRSAVTNAFPDSCVEDLHCCVSPQEVHEKDRHVVQAAIRSKSELIVTFNLKDFPSSALEGIKIRARHPSEFLLTLFSIEPLRVARRLREIAESNGEELLHSLQMLKRHVPAFIDHFAATEEISLGDD